MIFIKSTVCFFLILLFGCQNSAPLTFPRKETLRLSFKYNPITIDPRKNSDPLSCNLINMLFEGLVHLEPDGSCSCALASSIKISKKKTRYTFHLKETFWSDGSPITAYDFEASWKKILHPDFSSINAYFLYPIKNAKAAKMGLVSLEEVGVYALDAKTLSIKLEHPNPHFLKMLAFVTYFPVSKHQSELTNKEWSSKGVFSGAFVLKEWKNDDYMVLEKNPYFWNASEVNLKHIIIHILPDENTALKLHEMNEIDWIGSFFSPVPDDVLEALTKSNKDFSSDYAGTSACFFNMNSYPFDNINIRKAFAYAIEKDLSVRYVCLVPEAKAYGIIPPLLKNRCNNKFLPDGSRELALHYFKKGLEELGITQEEFPKLVFTYFHSDLEKAIASTLQEMWKKTLGIHVFLEQLDVKIFLDKLYKRNFQFCLMSIIAQYFDRMNFLERFVEADGIKNYSGWENPSYKYLIALSYHENRPAKREFYLNQAEGLLLQEMPCIPLYHHSFCYMKNPNLENIKISPIGNVDFRYVHFKE